MAHAREEGKNLGIKDAVIDHAGNLARPRVDAKKQIGGHR
jgi:hypothetical protein